MPQEVARLARMREAFQPVGFGQCLGFRQLDSAGHRLQHLWEEAVRHRLPHGRLDLVGRQQRVDDHATRRLGFRDFQKTLPERHMRLDAFRIESRQLPPRGGALQSDLGWQIEDQRQYVKIGRLRLLLL